MCFELDSRPPLPAVAGAAIDTADITLTSADGTKFAAYSAAAPGQGGPAMVVLPDVRGLHTFYKELADRFAERGVSTVAIDYFGRTTKDAKRDADFQYQEHVAQTKAPQIAQDVAAAVAYLRQGQGNARRSIFTVGFCFGGGNSWLQGMAGHGLAGAIGFYGHPTRAGRDGSPAVAEQIGRLECPLLILAAGADQGIPVAEVEKFQDALKKAGKPFAAHVYEGAPHSFFDRRFEEHAEASADAWERIHAFIKKNAK